MFILKRLMTNRKQLVDTRKEMLQRNKANLKNKSAQAAEDTLNENLEFLEHRVAEVEAMVEGLLAAMIDEDETTEQVE